MSLVCREPVMQVMMQVDVLTASLVLLLRAAVSGLGGAALGRDMHARGTARVPS